MVAKLLVAVQEMCFHLLEVGPDVGLRDRNLLEAAVERPRQSAFGDDAYPTHASKAAALLESLARNHPFVDGNKQIAVLASFVFLELNGTRSRPRTTTWCPPSWTSSPGTSISPSSACASSGGSRRVRPAESAPHTWAVPECRSQAHAEVSSGRYRVPPTGTWVARGSTVSRALWGVRTA